MCVFTVKRGFGNCCVDIFREIGFHMRLELSVSVRNEVQLRGRRGSRGDVHENLPLKAVPMSNERAIPASVECRLDRECNLQIHTVVKSFVFEFCTPLGSEVLLRGRAGVNEARRKFKNDFAALVLPFSVDKTSNNVPRRSSSSTTDALRPLVPQTNLLLSHHLQLLCQRRENFGHVSLAAFTACRP